MTDQTLSLIASAVVGVQLVLPLVLGGPEVYKLFSDDPVKTAKKAQAAGEKKKKLKDSSSASATASASASASTRGLALAPLRCSGCGAAVPLLAESFPCPFCKHAIQPPADYVATLQLRRRAAEELQRAEKFWRRARLMCSKPVAFVLYLLVPTWGLSVLVGSAILGENDSDWPKMLLFLAFILAVVMQFVGLAYAATLKETRDALPSYPPLSEFNGPDQAGACQHCQAPIAFEANSFSATCMYCGGENFRQALASAAHADAAKKEEVAHYSLASSVNALLDARKERTSVLGLLAIAELFYAVIFGLGAIFG